MTSTTEQKLALEHERKLEERAERAERRLGDIRDVASTYLGTVYSQTALERILNLADGALKDAQDDHR